MKKIILIAIIISSLLISGCTSVGIQPNNLKNLETAEVTPYSELIVGNKFNKFNIKSGDSPSRLRDELIITSSGNISNKDGEIYLNTGTNYNGYAQIKTRERGRYIAGSTGLVGLGIRIPELPTGNQYAEWGYFDERNGFGFGIDSQCTYIFILDDMDKSKVCQSDWNQDVMDGLGDSGHTLDLSDGNIFQIPFQWYGYGSINFLINTDKGSNTDTKINHRIHTSNIYKSVSVEDPNQPINVKISNDGTADNFEIYIGGRQFSTLGSDNVISERPVSAILEDYTVTTDTTWTPLIAIRKSELHPITNSKNTINIIFEDYIAQGINNDLKLRATYDGDIINGTFTSPESWDGETGIEVSTINDGLVINSSNEGLVISRFLVTPTTIGAKQTRTESVERTKRIIIGEDAPIIIWGQKATTNDVLIRATILNWLEEW